MPDFTRLEKAQIKLMSEVENFYSILKTKKVGFKTKVKIETNHMKILSMIANDYYKCRGDLER